MRVLSFRPAFHLISLYILRWYLRTSLIPNMKEQPLGPVDESDFMAFKRLSWNMEINLVNGALKAADLKRDIPDPVPGS